MPRIGSPKRIVGACLVTALVVGGATFISGRAPVRARANGEWVVLSAADATSVAVRGERVQVEPTAPTPTIAQDPLCLPSRAVPIAAQVVVDVRAQGSAALLWLLRRQAGQWICEGPAMSARIGRSGVHELAQRVGGDGSTPGGVFALGEMAAPNGDVFQFFGNGLNPGVAGGWHQIQPNDCWWADPGTSAYNTLIASTGVQCQGENEFLSNFVHTYSRAALIDANMGPDRVGDEPGETPQAAAIFLHRHAYTSAGATKPTSGCVSLAASDLDFVLLRLVPEQTWFTISRQN